MTTKKVWGNACWLLFHAMAVNLKDEHHEMAQSILNLIVHICKNLPCPDCSRHSIEILRKINRQNIKTKSDLVTVIFEFHNIVNERTQKKQFTKEEHDNLYKQVHLGFALKQWYSVMLSRMPGEKNMLYSISRNIMIKNVNSFFNKNKHVFNLSNIG
jgi:hypothetical protein